MRRKLTNSDPTATIALLFSALPYYVFSVPLFSETHCRKACKAAWNQLYISSNGDVSVCPRINRYVVIGNLLQNKIETILCDKTLKDLREQFKTKRYTNNVCGICMNNNEYNVPIDLGF